MKPKLNKKWLKGEIDMPKILKTHCLTCSMNFAVSIPASDLDNKQVLKLAKEQLAYNLKDHMRNCRPSLTEWKKVYENLASNETNFDDLDIYKEKGKVIINKKSQFLGVVYLDNMEEVRKVGAFLYRLIIEEDMKKYGNKKPNRKAK